MSMSDIAGLTGLAPLFENTKPATPHVGAFFFAASPKDAEKIIKFHFFEIFNNKQ